eukprot:TRINITY_DN65703_c0_g1_i1.p1 TRINITY_DN65703_c0_g1~~TRINITY_DN65703_c0_g1_i1.p1  ORF type:complete len:386 (+),score=97.63 TRINITY_DN65703_c0_g1_i1:39-1160(+)
MPTSGERGMKQRGTSVQGRLTPEPASPGRKTICSDVQLFCTSDSSLSAEGRDVAARIAEVLRQRRPEDVRQVRSVSPPPLEAHDPEHVPRREEVVVASARHLAARYVMSELHAMSLDSARQADMGVASLCARRVLECDEFCSRLTAAMPQDGTSPHAPLTEAARHLVSTELGRPYEQCCEMAATFLRPLLESRLASQAAPCREITGLSGSDGTSLADEVSYMQDQRTDLREAIKAEHHEQNHMREALNAELADVVHRMCVLLSQYRVPSEDFDLHMADHLLALLEALQAKLKVLTVDVESATYTPDTIAALRQVCDAVDEKLSNASLEESTMQGLVAQYASVANEQSDFAKINDECHALEAEKAQLERELRLH